MKIYSKTGDDGTTSLFGGDRIYKNHERVDAYGQVDELNAQIGLLADVIADQDTLPFLRKIQNHLFIIGSHLATIDEKYKASLPEITDQMIQEIETTIDHYNESIPPMKHFIIPGGHSTISICHIARTVCRRAERAAVGVNSHTPLSPMLIQYLNRLSDYLFVLARKLHCDLNIPEIPWKGK
jgi:cob(I)alamin adenosyltransferase